jgi:hypothetical protein
LWIERPGVRGLPESALYYLGDAAYYWAYQKGQATRTEVQTGASDGEWIEVINRRAAPSEGMANGGNSWVPVDGTEQVILGDLSLVTDGAPVEVGPAAEGPKQ